MPMEIKVPSLGQSVPEATVGKWLKKVGDEVATDEAVVELETDKINMEVTAFRGGTLTEIRAEAGESIAVGDVLGLISEEGEEAGEPEGDEPEAEEAPEGAEEPEAEEESEEPAEEEPAKKPAAKKEKADKAEAEKAGKAAPRPKPAAARREAVIPDDMKTSPAVRKLAREHRLDLTEIEGSGKDGRVTKADVLEWLERDEAEPAEPAETAEAAAGATEHAAEAREYGPDEPVERVPMSPIRKTIARRMSESKRTAAHVTTVDEADMGALVELRERMKGPFFEQHGVKLTYMPFIAKAAIAALKEFPDVNATIEGDDIVYHRFWHLGVAVHTEAGLVVPVVKHADRKSMVALAHEIDVLAKKSRERKLEMDDIQGGTFTLTNAGGHGALLTTPIISYPEVAVLGIHKISERPVARNGQVVIRPMIWLALSYDHRLVDGTPAVLFLRRVCELLEEPDRLLLEA